MDLVLSLFLLVLCSSSLTEGSVVSKGTPPWTHQFHIPSSGIKVEWKNVPDPDQAGNSWLEIQMTGNTTGYVAVGLSPHGGMTGADMVIGWVHDDGKSHLKDFYGVRNGEPVLDPQQDYELLSGQEIEGVTTIKFRRRWQTCDENHDLAVVNDTMRLIWALGPSDPMLNDDGTVTNLDWHSADTRGAQSLYLHDDAFPDVFPDERPDLFPDVKHWDMTMDNNTVNGEHTTYYCKIVKFPHLDKKHHMIGWKPILTPENKQNVHHICFYECMIPPELGGTESVFEEHTQHSGGKCYTKNMPPEWTKYCVTFLFVFVAGSEGEMFPQHVGSPLGEMHGGATYFMMEIHYDNPTQRNFVDRSGVRLFYTDELRKHDGSVILMGYRITPFLLLPPKQPNFVTHGICARECTEQTIPESGIHIINTLVHAHLSGRKIRLRHFRNGKEQPLVAEDNYYDFNYQQSRTLKDEVTVLPGDELIVECEYNTEDNNRVVLGGLSTTQEMCQTFFVYYPRVDLMQCTSQAEFHDFFTPLGINEVEGDVLKSIKMPYRPEELTTEEAKFDPPDNAKELEETGDGASFKSVFDHITINSPPALKGRTVGDHLKMLNWTNTDMAKYVEKQWQFGKHYAYCTGHGRKRHALKNTVIPYPSITEPLKRDRPEVCENMANKISTTATADAQSYASVKSLTPATLFVSFILQTLRIL